MPDVTERLREGAHAILEKAGELQERIRHRAHAIWEREGRPHGRDRDHWHAAESELPAEAAAALPPRRPPEAGAKAPRRQAGRRALGRSRPEEAAPRPGRKAGNSAADAQRRRRCALSTIQMHSRRKEDAFQIVQVPAAEHDKSPRRHPAAAGDSDQGSTLCPHT